MEAEARSLYARVGSAAIPKILGLLDRNRVGPTYGCFDKSYWHYKTASFPSGMYQEFVLPLALVYRYRLAGAEEFHHHPSLREWVRAGIEFAARSARRDGSCDDYFPYEGALGAAAFSLYACTESALLLDMREDSALRFFRLRARWLLEHDETGILANHHALVAIALYNVHLLTADDAYSRGARAALDRLVGWQSPEGWFPEYAGCDLGYHSATIDFLAKYHRKSGDTRLLEPLRRAVRFAADFIHPDGSYGGTYGSRNTAIFFPHGFELLAGVIPEAGWIVERYLAGIHNGKRVFLEDDRLVAHLAYNHLQAALDVSDRLPWAPEENRSHLWPGAGLYVRREPVRTAILSVAKGGVMKVFCGDRLLYADSGLVAQQADGTCLVTHLMDRYEHSVDENSVRVGGTFGFARYRVPTPLTAALFHLFMTSVGRFFRNPVRALLQKLLIVGKGPSRLRFQRTVQFGAIVRVVDEIWDERPHRDGRARLVRLYAGTEHSSIYVAMSNAYQSACLLPWTDLSPHLEELGRTGNVKIERSLGEGNIPESSGEMAAKAAKP